MYLAGQNSVIVAAEARAGTVGLIFEEASRILANGKHFICLLVTYLTIAVCCHRILIAIRCVLEFVVVDGRSLGP